MLSRQLVIVPGATANEDAALAPGQHPGIISGVLDTVPARLQEQTLLRIHAFGFGGRDVKEERVEQIIFVEQPCPLAGGLACHGVAGLIVGIHIPPLARNLGDAIPAARNVLPELLEVSGLRELTGHANHRNRL